MKLRDEACQHRQARASGFAWIMMLGLLARTAAATDWYVGGSLMAMDTNNCTSAATPCMTIQAAINKASAGDTIHVAAGVYLELTAQPLSVNKTLTLLGAQHGVDARNRTAAESVVSDLSGTYITANNVIIDGFTFENSTNGAFTGYGIDMGAGTTGTQIVNNIIQDNIAGIGLANTGASPVLIRHNLIENNNVTGPASGDGIYTDQFVGGGAVTNVLIVENAFKGNGDAGIDVSDTDSAHPVSNIDVSSNSFDQNGRAVLLFNTHTSTITTNTVSNCTLAASAAVRLFDGNSSLSIMNNDLRNGVGYAIHLGVLFADPSSGVVINKNNIGANSISFPLGGLAVDAGSHVGTVNAQCNWWGSPTGPAATSNPGGTGEAVVGDANFKPWWTTPSQTTACPSECKRGDGDGEVEDGEGHQHHASFDDASCEEGSGRVVDDDQTSGRHFESTSVSSDSFTSGANSQTLTLVGSGLHDGLPVNFTMIAVDNRGLAPGAFTLILSDGYKITGSFLTGTLVIQ